MDERIRAFDWSKTSLRPIRQWPQSLRTAVNMVLQSPVPLVMLWGPDGIMIYNDAYSVFTGARHPSLLGSKVVEGWPEVADFNRNVLEQGLSGKALSYKDQRLTLYRNNVPEEVWMDLNYSPIMDESGTPAGVLAIVVETTQRVLAEQKQKHAEEALHAERDRLQTLLLQAPAIIAVLKGPQHVFELANPLYMQLIGEDRDIIGKTVADALPEIIEQGFIEILDSVYRTGTPFLGDEVAVELDRTGDGNLETVFLNFMYQPLRSGQGEVDGILVHAVDVTEQVTARHNVEELATRVEQQAQTLDIALSSIQDFVYTFDTSGRFTYSNKPLLDLLGITLDDIIGKNFHDLGYPHDLATTLQAQIQAVVDTGKPLTDETPFTSPSDKPGYYEYIFVPIFDKNREVALVAESTKDITQRKQSEEALRESEERFQVMSDTAPVLIWISGTDTLCTWFNKPWLEFTGRTMEQEVGNGWAEEVHPEDVDRCLDIYMTAFDKQQDFRMEYRLRRYDGEYRWILGSATPRYASDGGFLGYIGSCIDITERRQLERQKDAFLAIASHELRTPLTTIKAYAQMLDRKGHAQGDCKVLPVGSVHAYRNPVTRRLWRSCPVLPKISAAAAAPSECSRDFAIALGPRASPDRSALSAGGAAGTADR